MELFQMMSKRLSNSSQDSFESAQRQGTSNFVGTSARGYSGNAIPIMESPDKWKRDLKWHIPSGERRAVIYDAKD